MRRGAGPMSLKRTIGLILVIAGVILGVAKALGSESQSGDWTIRRSEIPGKVEFSLMDARAGHHFHTSSDWPASDFPGLDFSKPGRQEVHFTISRDAGKFECEGFLHDGERSEEHTSELQSLTNLVCRLLLEKKKKHGKRT